MSQVYIWVYTGHKKASHNFCIVLVCYDLCARILWIRLLFRGPASHDCITCLTSWFFFSCCSNIFLSLLIRKKWIHLPALFFFHIALQMKWIRSWFSRRWVSLNYLLLCVLHILHALTTQLVPMQVLYLLLRRLCECFTELLSLSRIHVQQHLNVLTSILQDFLHLDRFTYM